MSKTHVWRVPQAKRNAEQLAAYWDECASSAERPLGKEVSFHRVAFYNVGWNETDKKRKPETLAELVNTICRTKDVDAFGICEVFNIVSNDTLRKEEVMKAILDKLNENSEGSEFWTGRTDVHYIFIWNNNALNLVHHEVIDCGIPEQAYRQAQYFKFSSSLGEDELHIVHNHSPSSEVRKLTKQRRKDICSTCWNHVMKNTCAEQPAVVFGGDFNCSPIFWALCFKDLFETQSTRRSVQMCTGRTEGGHTGDNAVAFNVRAFQQESGFGVYWQTKENAFSDDHNVIFVPFNGKIAGSWRTVLHGLFRGVCISECSPRVLGSTTNRSKDRRRRS